jgi:hypothetical protein
MKKIVSEGVCYCEKEEDGMFLIVNKKVPTTSNMGSSSFLN